MADGILTGVREWCPGDTFKARAYDNVAKAIAAFGQKITSGKQVAHLKGVGKASVQKVASLSYYSYHVMLSYG